LADAVLYEVQDGIAVIRINRPEAANAVNQAVMHGLADSLSRAADDSEVRAVILTATGSRVFVSGGDLKEFHEELHTAQDVYEKFALMRANLYRLATFGKPVIAAINGTARGGGAELAVACHFRIASDTASIGFVQVNLGISTGWGGAALLAGTVGRQKALRLLLTGTVLTAQEAKEISLFDEVVSADMHWETAWAFARQIANQPAEAVQGIIQSMYQSEALCLEEAMERETRLCASLWNADAHMQAVESFMNRRKN
jgi:enoyl-CoA hydratase